MTSWIWMKGVEVAIADPPTDHPKVDGDDREPVKDLIQQHSAKIEKVREGIKDDPLYDPTKHDDLWILRFVLSHKQKTKPAIKAAKHTLEFRNKHNLDEHDIRDKLPHKLTSGNVYEYWKERCNGDAIITVHPDPQRSVIMFLKFAHFNTDAANTLSDEVWDDAFIYTSEFVHQHLDYVTRTTGLLTRSIRLIDMRGVTLSHLDRKSTQRDSKIMAQMEDCYPQLLQTIFLCYPPTFMHIVWSLVRPIMPKRILDKADLIEPDRNSKERDRLLKFMTMEQLPVDFGGLNDVPPKDW